MWDLIVSVPDHCLSFYSTKCLAKVHDYDVSLAALVESIV